LTLRSHNLKKSTYIVLLVLSIVGLIDSLYLYYVKITASPILCFQGSTGCQVVANSQYATLYGIPNGLIGALGYSAILGLLIVFRIWPKTSNTVRYLLFGLSLLGFLYSIYLTSISFIVLKTECPFCLISAVTMTTILIISIFELKNIN
jgi:uncharacterized membrane protein